MPDEISPIDPELHRLLVWWCKHHRWFARYRGVDAIFVSGDDECCKIKHGPNEVIAVKDGKFGRMRIK